MNGGNQVLFAGKTSKPEKMKIPKKYANFVFVLLAAFFMSMLMSFIVVLINEGFTANLIFLWLKSWAFVFPIAFFVAYLVVPKIRKFVDSMTEYTEKFVMKVFLQN